MDLRIGLVLNLNNQIGIETSLNQTVAFGELFYNENLKFLFELIKALLE